MNTIRPDHLLSLGVLMLSVGPALAQTLEPLPEGETGIAAKYAGDAGIKNDPAVLFVENFEDVSGADGLRRKWDTVFHDDTIRIADEPENVHSGRKAVEFIFPQREDATGNGLMKHFQDERDVLFLRYYHKFEKDLDITGAGSFHNGGAISAHYHADGRSTPGIRADGRNKFLFEIACAWFSGPKPGHFTVYAYHPEQRGDYGDAFYPTGEVSPNTSLHGDFGPHFVPRPNYVPELDRWYCYEIMVQSNTPGQRDGRVACWVDGKLVADFPNMRLRDIDSLKIDYLTIGGYLNPNKVRTNKLWFDDVVAATSYIGPQRSAGDRR